MQENRLFNWFRSFAPAPLSAPPKEWFRAACGVGIAVLLMVWSGLWLFGSAVTLSLTAPVAASAVLLFAASSSPFAQPWSVVGGNLVATLIGVSLAISGIAAGPAAMLAAGLTLAGLFLLRCPHPPSCALAMIAALGGPALRELGYALLYPVLFNSLLLVAAALLYNNLTRHPYPKPRLPRDNLHHTRDPLPGDRLSFSQDDVDQALREFGEYVDITRDDLERLIKQTEKHAFRRNMGEISAADIMSRDLYWSTPDAFINQGWETLQQRRLRSLPILERGSRKLVGIVTLVDLLKHFQPSPARVNFGQLKYLRGTKMRAIMSTPVVSVKQSAHMADLVSMLCDRGLHCLPVVDDEERLVGMITQTDLIAALYRNWLKHLPD